MKAKTSFLVRRLLMERGWSAWLLATMVWLPASEPFAPVGTWHPPHPATNHNFGFSVAVSGDILVVGAPGDPGSATGVNGDQTDNTTPWAGAAYVYRRGADGWELEAYLKPHATAANDHFGMAVAISGDTLVVGGPLQDHGVSGVNNFQEGPVLHNSGAAYVFVRENGIWAQQAYLKASNAGDGDQFGGAVAISGDTIAVGARGEFSAATGVNAAETDDSAEGAGAVYIFRRIGNNWNQQAYLKPTHIDAGDGFGTSVALAPDPQGAPGDVILAVGAIDEDSAGADDPSNNELTSAGAVYVFQRRAGIWGQAAYLKAVTPAARTWWGDSVAVRDGLIAVGSDEGVDFVQTFQRNSAGEWVSDATLTVKGGAVALGAGGVLAVADYGAQVIHVLTRENGGWQSVQEPIPAPQPGGSFGYAVALDGPTLISGAPYVPTPLQVSNAGYAAVFEQPAPTTPPDLRITSITAALRAGGGFEITIAGAGATGGAVLTLYGNGDLTPGGWQSLSTATADGQGDFTFGPFSEPASATSRFYQVSQE